MNSRILRAFLRRTIAPVVAVSAVAAALLCTTVSARAEEPSTILIAGFDVARELYTDINNAFIKSYKASAGKVVDVQGSFAGSSKQARSIVDGLNADVAAMNQDTDIALIAEKGLIAKEWRTRLPDNAAPYSSTIAILVRKGNPKKIKDWADLAKPGVELVIPNPKTSGNGRYTYLAAWASVIKGGGDEAKAGEFVKAIFKNVVVSDTGGRGATLSFVNKGIGDALLTFENELLLITKKQSPGEYELIYPTVSILAEMPVSVVDKVVDARGSRKLAMAYVDYLWSGEAQKIHAKHFYRPRNATVLAENKELFPALTLATIDDVFGGWAKANAVHFADGGVYDKIFAK